MLSLRNELETQQSLDDFYEARRKQHKNVMDEEFNEPKDNKPMTTGAADYKHKQMMKQYNDVHFGDRMKEPYLGNDKAYY